MQHFLCFIVFIVATTKSGAQYQKCSRESITISKVLDPVIHGEGPHWDPRKQVLYFVDISNQTVNRYKPSTGEFSYLEIDGGPVSPIIPARKVGWFFVGRGIDLVLFKWDEKSSIPNHIHVLATVDKDKPRNRMNDGKADASGRLWIGTMGHEGKEVEPYKGSLYSFSGKNNFTANKHVSRVTVSNGLGWNQNDTLMYYIDSPTRNIDAFDFDLQRGSIKNRRTVFSLSKYNINGVPDGMTVDNEGMLWVAVYFGGIIIRINPSTGELMQRIRIPASQVTSCAFGGPGLSTLYVTSSRRGLTPKQLEVEPLAGAVFAVNGLNVQGQRKTNTAKITN